MYVGYQRKDRMGCARPARQADFAAFPSPSGPDLMNETKERSVGLPCQRSQAEVLQTNGNPQRHIDGRACCSRYCRGHGCACLHQPASPSGIADRFRDVGSPGAPATASSEASKQASPSRFSVKRSATAQQQAKDLTTLLTPPPPQAATGGSVPEFDIVHITPTGEAVVAGRAAPGTTVELLRDGELHDRAVVDQFGQFAMIPRPLPPGTYGLTLRSRQPDGKEITSKQSVAVVLEPTSERPTVALMTPDKPTVVLSQPPASCVRCGRNGGRGGRH